MGAKRGKKGRVIRVPEQNAGLKKISLPSGEGGVIPFLRGCPIRRQSIAKTLWGFARKNSSLRSNERHDRGNKLPQQVVAYVGIL